METRETDTLVADHVTAVAERELLAADLAVELHDRGVVGLSQHEVAREADRLDIEARILAMFLHDAEIEVHPWEV